MSDRSFLISQHGRMLRSLIFAAAVLVLATDTAQSGEVRFSARPTGPSLGAQAAEKFITWMDENAPRWFHEKISWKGKRVWGRSEKVLVYFDEWLQERTTQIVTRDESGCWLLEKRSIVGTLYEVRYGVMHWKLSTTGKSGAQLVHLYKSAQKLSKKKTMESVVNADDKSIIKFLAEQVPIMGEIIDKGTQILGTGDMIDEMVEIQTALTRFQREYDEISRHIGKNVVTVEGGYDAGEARSRGEQRFGGTEKREKADCNSEPWKAMKPGDRNVAFTTAKTLTPKARAVLLEELDQPKNKRNFGNVLAEMTVDVHVKASVAIYARANSASGGQGKDTGIDVAKRDILIVNVDPNDDWSAGSDQPCTRKSNADGLTKCYDTFSMSKLSTYVGSLVGRIGDGPFFLIGTSYENEVTVSGRLRLYYWDSDSDNNSGFITANLVVKRRSGLNNN